MTTKEVPFYKMVASGNDFVVVDNRQGLIADPEGFTREVCPRHTGIGADGVLLIESVGAPLGGRPSRGRPRGAAPTNRIDYRVRILNADGSSAEACGNGFRCVTLFAHERLGLGPKQRFEALSGIIEGEMKGKRARVRLVNPTQFETGQKIEVLGRKLHYSFINTGVPHTVIFVEGIDQIPVHEIGKEVRFHPQFVPRGTNVNFVEVAGPKTLKVRTYERGVEAETLACGTGSTASAVVSGQLGYVETPVEVKTRSGEILTVDFTKTGGIVRDVYLEGDVKFVFEGKWGLQ